MWTRACYIIESAGHHGNSDCRSLIPQAALIQSVGVCAWWAYDAAGMWGERSHQISDPADLDQDRKGLKKLLRWLTGLQHDDEIITESCDLTVCITMKVQECIQTKLVYLCKCMFVFYLFWSSETETEPKVPCPLSDVTCWDATCWRSRSLLVVNIAVVGDWHGDNSCSRADTTRGRRSLLH